MEWSAAESRPFCCAAGGLVSLHLRGGGRLTSPAEQRPYKADHLQRGDRAARPLSAPPSAPRVSDLFDKTQRLGLRRVREPFLLPADRLTTPSGCQITHSGTIRDSDFHIWLLRGPVCPPPAAHWEELCPDNPPPLHSSPVRLLLLSLSYY